MKNQGTSNSVILLLLIITAQVFNISIVSSIKISNSKFLDVQYDTYGNPYKETRGYFTTKNGYLAHFKDADMTHIYTALAFFLIGTIFLFFCLQFNFWVTKKSVKYKKLSNLLESSHMLNEEDLSSPVNSLPNVNIGSGDGVSHCTLIKNKLTFQKWNSDNTVLPKFLITNALQNNKVGSDSYVELLDERIVGIEVKFEKLGGFIVDEWIPLDDMTNSMFNKISFCQSQKKQNNNLINLKKISSNDDKNTNESKDKTSENEEESKVIHLDNSYYRRLCNVVKFRFNSNQEKEFYPFIRDSIIKFSEYDVVNTETDLIEYNEGETYLNYIFNKPIEYNEVSSIYIENHDPELNKFKKDCDVRIYINIVVSIYIQN